MSSSNSDNENSRRNHGMSVVDSYLSILAACSRMKNAVETFKENHQLIHGKLDQINGMLWNSTGQDTFFTDYKPYTDSMYASYEESINSIARQIKNYDNLDEELKSKFRRYTDYNELLAAFSDEENPDFNKYTEDYIQSIIHPDIYSVDNTLDISTALNVTNSYQSYFDSIGVTGSAYEQNGMVYFVLDNKWNNNFGKKLFNAASDLNLGNGQKVMVTFGGETYKYDINDPNYRNQTSKFAIISADENNNPFVIFTGANSGDLRTDSPNGKYQENESLLVSYDGIVIPYHCDFYQYAGTSIELEAGPRQQVGGGVTLEMISRLSLSAGTNKSQGGQYGTFDVIDPTYGSTSAARGSDHAVNDHKYPNVLLNCSEEDALAAHPRVQIGSAAQGYREGSGGWVKPHVVGTLADIGGEDGRFPVYLIGTKPGNQSLQATVMGYVTIGGKVEKYADKYMYRGDQHVF